MANNTDYPIKTHDFGDLDWDAIMDQPTITPGRGREWRMKQAARKRADRDRRFKYGGK